MESLIALLMSAESVLLVIATAVSTGFATGLNERRKRRYTLEDRLASEKQERDGRRIALLLGLLDHRSEYIRAQTHAPGSFRGEAVDTAAHSMLNTAAATGDAEVIKAVDYFLSERFDDEGELLDLVSKRVAALEASPKKRRWWQLYRRHLDT